MAESKLKVRSRTPLLDTRLMELRGPAKLRALQAGLQITNGDIVKGTGAYPQWVPQELSGERRRAETRIAIAAALDVPLDEVSEAIGVPLPDGGLPLRNVA